MKSLRVIFAAVITLCLMFSSTAFAETTKHHKKKVHHASPHQVAHADTKHHAKASTKKKHKKADNKTA